MKNKQSFSANNVLKTEFIFSLLLIILLLFFIEPFGLFMTPPVVMMILTVLIVIFGIFATLVWREKARDEREHLHKMIAGRFGYLAGAGVLMIGIVTQTLNHTLDSWLVIALIAMILGKIVGLLYGQNKH